MKKKMIWKKMTALILSALMLFGTIPVSADTVYNEKIDERLQGYLSEMEDDDLIMTWIHVATITDEELDALILAETNYDPTDYIKGDMKDPEHYEEYHAVRMEIKERENTARTQLFYDTYLNDQYFLRSMSGFIGSIFVEIPKALILEIQNLEEIERISSYKLPDEVSIINYGTETLDKNVADTMAEQYLELDIHGRENCKPQEVEIEYFGNYSGYEVVGMTFWDVFYWNDTSISTPIGDYLFVFGTIKGPKVNGLYAYKDNEFYLLTDICDQGLISNEEVARLATNFPLAYQVQDDFLQPVLYTKTEEQIKTDYLKKLQEESSQYADMTVDDLEILQYYGRYRHYEVVLIYGKDWVVTDAEHEVKIGGYQFTFGTTSYYPEHLLAWKDGEFLTMKEAAAEDILFDGAIYKIAQIHGAAPKTETSPYSDVVFDRDWFALPVYKAYLMKGMTGMGEVPGTFGPYEKLSRAQFALILYRMSLEPGEERNIIYQPIFADIPENLWYTDAVLWAYENGIVTGYENGLFGPADPITREQMAAMLHRYAAYAQYDMNSDWVVDFYKDIRTVSPYAEEAIRWCVKNGVIKGDNLRILPHQHTSRAEAATMITRFAEKYIYSVD